MSGEANLKAGTGIGGRSEALAAAGPGVNPGRSGDAFSASAAPKPGEDARPSDATSGRSAAAPEAKAGGRAADAQPVKAPGTAAMIGRAAEVELRKILAQFKYRALPVPVALAPLIVLLLNRLPGSMIRFSPANLPFTLLSLAAYVLLPLAACMLAADLFAGERERGELKIPLTRPVSRPALALGKLAAIVAYQAGLLAVLLALSLAAGALSGAGSGGLDLPAVLAAYALTLLPAAAFGAAAIFASTLARSATSGFLLGVLLLAALGGIGLLFPAVSSAMPTEYATLYKSVIGSEVAYGQLLTGAGILLGFGTVLTTAQILLFDAREV
ncbi:ABC transporter permease [Saccharibacillus sp. CPCC 101409]|uniref:ABC transporter permease n=1 Tax=Saccharibacillus sp. CPCC 101409 TaxID=3058041 RepID=UPI002671E145|nr:ABC transporter permease [Saccharibacillus sp. CPCC 101409]MDO3410273.1 ABC transporter permease [Saccharibacillus sp. CPCC 101409]